ncbi:uncharacterized protein [Nicotiana sylvestris]|uniref:uncharacterized protein n=1 Tax=Nicotiana sylvestris TaxID=4096 RepID=UPI00388C3ADB
MYFPDEEVMQIDELELPEEPGWKLFFDGAANAKGVGIGAVLISETGHHYPVTAQLRFYCTNNMAEYEGEWETRDLKLIPYQQCLHDLSNRFRLVEFRHIPRVHNEVADALATLASMLHHPDKIHVDPLHIQVHDQHVYCNMIEEEVDGEPWFYDVKEYLRMGIYPEQATGDQKRAIRRLSSGFFLSGVLYKKTPDLGLLRCIDASQATTVMTEPYIKNHIDVQKRPPHQYSRSAKFMHLEVRSNALIPSREKDKKTGNELIAGRIPTKEHRIDRLQSPAEK